MFHFEILAADPVLPVAVSTEPDSGNFFAPSSFYDIQVGDVPPK